MSDAHDAVGAHDACIQAAYKHMMDIVSYDRLLRSFFWSFFSDPLAIRFLELPGPPASEQVRLLDERLLDELRLVCSKLKFKCSY